jgi:hypothetical protein
MMESPEDYLLVECANSLLANSLIYQAIPGMLSSAKREK